MLIMLHGVYFINKKKNNNNNKKILQKKKERKSGKGKDIHTVSTCRYAGNCCCIRISNSIWHVVANNIVNKIKKNKKEKKKYENITEAETYKIGMKIEILLNIIPKNDVNCMSIVKETI